MPAGVGTARYVTVSLAAGMMVVAMDGVINANPLAVGLYAVYRPIARQAANAPAGLAIDLAYGFLLAGIFLILYWSLPGSGQVSRGLSFAVIVWFFRAVMCAASQWVMFEVPLETLGYMLLTGFGEMLVVGLFFGLALRPSSRARKEDVTDRPN